MEPTAKAAGVIGTFTVGLATLVDALPLDVAGHVVVAVLLLAAAAAVHKWG